MTLLWARLSEENHLKQAKIGQSQRCRQSSKYLLRKLLLFRFFEKICKLWRSIVIFSRKVAIVLVIADAWVADNWRISCRYRDFSGVCLPHNFRFLQREYHQIFLYLLFQKKSVYSKGGIMAIFIFGQLGTYSTIRIINSVNLTSLTNSVKIV